jgi:Family of unknown function (DUF6459)
MRTLPPDRSGVPLPAPAGHASGGPEEAGPDGPGCPRPPARSRPRGRPRQPSGPRPLPDPAAVRLCLIPDSAPPYDAEVAAAGPPGPPSGTSRGPAGIPGQADRPGSPGRAGSSAPRPPPAQPGSRGRPGSPSVPGWPGRFAQVLAETLAGSRPPRQLVPWTTERARERIQRLGPQLSAGQQPRVRRVVTFLPTADAMEMTVVVAFGPRVHALAVRLERAGSGPSAAGRPAPGRWLCTTVEAA